MGVNISDKRKSTLDEGNYFSLVLCITAVVIAIVGGLNYIADPLGIYNPPVIRGVNDAHPAALGYSRIYKAENVKRLKPDVIITGTSRADSGLNPKPDQFGGLSVYNFAMPAASIKEQRRTLEFAQAVHPLKTAIITLDFFAFNAKKIDNKQFDPARLSPEALGEPRSFFDTYGTMLALDTSVASFKQFRYMKHLSRYGHAEPNGHKVNTDLEADIEKNGAAKQFLHPANENEISTTDYDFNYSAEPGDDTFKHYEAMLDFTRKKGINTILVISPVHETYLKKLESEGKTPLALEWKQRLVDIDRAVAARYHTKPYPLWDFAYSNSITTERVPAADDKITRMKWFWDSNHYKEKTGDIVLEKILGLASSKHYPDFGIRLD